jgi:ribulose-5-phosphate 4-epimerase/fuculose-1-phosphate aldolase
MTNVTGLAERAGDAQVAAGLARLARAHRILAAEGHGDMTLGHLSWRDPRGRGFWIKRNGLGLDEVGRDDLLLLGFDGAVIVGDGERHREWPIHAGLLAARPELMAVGHSHPHWAVLFSATAETLRPLTNEGIWFDRPPGRFTLTSDLVDTDDLGRAHAAAMGEADAVFLRNHGVSFVGQSIEAMALTGIFLEKACRAQLELAATGLPFTWPDAAEAAAKRERIYPPSAIANFWTYYERRLDRR